MIQQLRLTSIKYRLTLLFFAITAGAILVIFFYVVPQLESNLTSEKLDALKRDATTYSPSLRQAIGRDVSANELDRLTRGIAEQADAGVTLFGIPRDELGSEGEPSPPYVISDSRAATRPLEPANKVVLGAADKRRVETGTHSQGGRRLAQVARPLYYRGQADWVVVFSEPLDDVADNVSLIERQILIAGAIALIVALVSGYYVSSALTRRVKQLEHAAREVAAGNFSEEPIPVRSDDELGQLASAFNEMQGRLARLDQARKEFIANASHELRTPIFSLGGFVELLQDEEIDEGTRNEFLATMSEQVDRLQKLATDLLDLSRLDAGSLEVEVEDVPLLALADKVAEEFAAAGARQKAAIEVSADAGGREVGALGDPTRVEQILRVLLDNALTHTGAGTTIEVAADAVQSRLDGRQVAELAVTDDGPGIPAQELPSVFDRFHTGDAGRGSGLGLAIARELAERMHGRLELTSRPGKTVFRLILPLAPSSAGTTAPQEPARERAPA
jgi:signal transduction histidine kinase